MADVLFVAIVIAFFGLTVLLVKACDRIIGPDPVLTGSGGVEQSDEADDADDARATGVTAGTEEEVTA